MGCHFPLQGIFPTQGSNPGLLHCRQILYHLNHEGRLFSKNKSIYTYLCLNIYILICQYLYVCTHTHTHTHTHPTGSVEIPDSFMWGIQPAFIAGAQPHHTMSPYVPPPLQSSLGSLPLGTAPHPHLDHHTPLVSLPASDLASPIHLP